jgi:hypothetical protein
MYRIDAEILFLRTDNICNIMETIANEKSIAGGLIHPTRFELRMIRDDLTRSIPEKDIQPLFKLSQSYRIYTWWSNLPVVDTKHAKDFLQWIQFNNNQYVNTITNYVFEDVVYNYYCILYHNYKLSIIPNVYHSLELTDTEGVEYTDKNVRKLYWVNAYAYKQNPSYYVNNNFYIVFHIDRWNFPQIENITYPE